MIIRYYDAENVHEVGHWCSGDVQWAATSFWLVPGTFDPNDC